MYLMGLPDRFLTNMMVGVVVVATSALAISSAQAQEMSSDPATA